MSKRNLILLIIILAIIAVVAFGFFYFNQPTNTATEGGNSGTNFIANFLPFGKSKTTAPTDTAIPTDISGYEPPTEEEQSDIKLKKVSSSPVAGFGVYMKERFKEIPNPSQTLPLSGEEGSGGQSATSVAPPTEFAPALRYVDRITGNIYQTFADIVDERKFSSTVIPKVYEAFFGNKGESVVMRYLKEGDKTIETFVGNIPKEFLGADSAGMNEIAGSFLPENISDMSVSPDASKIFYLFNTGNNAIGVTLALSAGAKVQVFDSPFTEWTALWPNNKMITMTTKPSANVPGFMYAIDPDKKDFSKVLGGINGLTTLTSPNGKLVLYGDNNLSLGIFDVGARNSSSLGVKTLPEKCVWGGGSDVIYCAVPKFTDSAEYPDAWYRGEVSFTDEIWKIDASSGNATKILDPVSEEGGEEVDAIKLALDEGQNYLLFVNKKDSYLWELNLK